MINIFVGNTLSFIGGITDFIFDLEYNEKQKILIGNCISTTCSIISCIFLKAYDGVISCIVTLIRLITIYLKDKYNKEFRLLFITFIFLYALVFINYSGVQTIILFISTMCSFIPKWIFKNMQLIRLSNIAAYVLSITYNILINNYAIILIQVISMISIFITFIKWSRSKK